ncbi:MAG: Catechol 2,3-dioxygenase [Chloroflexi bacterium]|jgi:catechol 2,3-dioxygenase-like lactoylglutathione lyase family enzyme|nr:MAG: Catechol 2,3-dioxygenase [Chloroflexota bacterium]
MRVTMNHTGFVVEDLERSRKFYIDGLGLEELKLFDVQSEELGHIVGYKNARIYASYLVASDGHALEIIEYKDPITKVSDESIQYERARTGGAHLAFFVEDCHVMWERLCAMGGKPLNPPIEVLPGMWECYMQDPDGNWIEITSDEKHNKQQFIVRQNVTMP